MASININNLRSVEWDQDYLWDIKFSEIPNQKIKHTSILTGVFADWFPAATVTDERANLTTGSHAIHQIQGYQFPSSTTQRNITVGFYDDVNNTILKWLEQWINVDILNNNEYLTPLDLCLKNLTIHKLNSKREMIRAVNYAVFPTLTVEYQGSSNPDSAIHSVTFAIAGETKTTG